MRVAGSNLFSQWLTRNQILFSEFQNLNSLQNDAQIKAKVLEMELVHITWSYNIFRHEDKFYLTGFWKGKDNSIELIKLPEEFQERTDKEYRLTGNDYNLILADLTSQTLWVIELETDKIRKLNFGIERPLANVNKKARVNDNITKAVVTNHSGLFLTADGQVFRGLLPSLVDTNHCSGRICDIQCGYEHFILLTDVGKVYTFGNGRRLQLGHDGLFNLETPTLVKALDGIKIIKVRAGGWHSLALSEFGDLYTWGWNDVGQLGIKSENLSSQPTPTLIEFYDCNGTPIIMDVKDITCGTKHSAALLVDNTVWTSGCNKYGQCGFPPESKEIINYFERAYLHDSDCKLVGGPWTTVIDNNK